MSSWYYLDNDKENKGSEDKVTTLENLTVDKEEKTVTDEKPARKARKKKGNE